MVKELCVKPNSNRLSPTKSFTWVILMRNLHGKPRKGSSGSKKLVFKMTFLNYSSHGESKQIIFFKEHLIPAGGGTRMR